MGRKPLSPGHLRHSLVIETLTDVDDGRGGSAPTWATVATVFGRVMPVSAREAFMAGQVQGTVSHRVTLRWIDGVRPKMRITWGSRILLIEGVRNLEEEGRILELDCSEERV